MATRDSKTYEDRLRLMGDVLNMLCKETTATIADISDRLLKMDGGRGLWYSLSADYPTFDIGREVELFEMKISKQRLTYQDCYGDTPKEQVQFVDRGNISLSMIHFIEWMVKRMGSRLPNFENVDSDTAQLILPFIDAVCAGSLRMLSLAEVRLLPLYAAESEDQLKLELVGGYCKDFLAASALNLLGDRGVKDPIQPGMMQYGEGYSKLYESLNDRGAIWPDELRTMTCMLRDATFKTVDSARSFFHRMNDILVRGRLNFNRLRAMEITAMKSAQERVIFLRINTSAFRDCSKSYCSTVLLGGNFDSKMVTRLAFSHRALHTDGLMLPVVRLSGLGEDGEECCEAIIRSINKGLRVSSLKAAIIGVHPKNCTLSKCVMLATSVVGDAALRGIKQIVETAIRSHVADDFEDYKISDEFEAPLMSLAHYELMDEHCESYRVNLNSLFSRESGLSHLEFDTDVDLSRISAVKLSIDVQSQTSIKCKRCIDQFIPRV